MLRVLCPTCWTVRAASLQSVTDNYEVLLVWREALDDSLDGEMRTHIVGVDTQMMKFIFLFGVCLGSLILRHSDNLSKSLKHKMLSAAEGQRIPKLTVSVIQKLHSDELFADFYQKVIKKHTRFGVADPCVPRKRRAPQHFEVGSSKGDFHVTPKDHYRQIYYEAIDYVVEDIHDRFNLPDYSIYRTLEELVVKVLKVKLTMLSLTMSAISTKVICLRLS